MTTGNVAQAITGIRRKFPDMDGLKNEGDVKQYVIEKILQALGWDQTEPEEVKKEYPVGNEKVDYALNPDSQTTVFIEAKKSEEKNLAKHQKQLINYCLQDAVNLAVLTNGQTWWLYVPRYEGPQGEGLKWGEKMFL